MDLLELIDTLHSYYQKNGLACWLSDNQLIAAIPDGVWNDMLRRNPTVESEVKKINSSSALAINYHQMLSEVSGITVDYEVDVAKPLIFPSGKGRSSMLDAVYYLDGVTYYVESKFLEPYYSNTHEVSPSYFIEKYYENVEVAGKWIKLFRQVHQKIVDGAFAYYDINQMLKHLLAIYRTKPSGKVILKNLIWKPTDAFYSCIRGKKSISGLKKRVGALENEVGNATEIIGKFITEDLHWDNCSIKIGFYNNELGRIEAHPQFATFKKKYLL